jgi:dimethylhistidine N-methyltransferase
VKATVQFYDELAPPPDVLGELLRGLDAEPRAISPKYFYDARGSALFDEICRQPEYYLTRTEMAILRAHARDIARRAPAEAVFVELGSGASEKVRLLLDAVRPRAYLAIDISRDFLLASTRRLARDYPWLEVHAACADYSRPLRLNYPPPALPRLAFFPGSSIGNFTPFEAGAFLTRLRHVVGVGGALVVGVDLRKDAKLLHAAYNDAAGVTAAFNRNVLQRLRREFNAEVAPAEFDHEAQYDERLGRIEMGLVSRSHQELRLAGRRFAFAPGDRLLTEYSYKYSIDEFQQLARYAGYTPAAVWTDPAQHFSVHYLELSA